LRSENFSIISFVDIWLMLFIVTDYVMLLIDEGMSMEHCWQDSYMEKLKYSEKNLTQCHFMNHNLCFT